VLRFVEDPLFIAGTMLYWAEGTKSLEMLIFSNSDPEMIRAMMLWFRKYCKVPEEKFRVQIHTHSLHKRSNVEKYWSRVSRVPAKCSSAVFGL